MTNQDSGLTVCILSYNRPLFLREAVESVLQQSHPAQFIRIFDNCSSDPAVAAVRKSLPGRVEWVGAETNRGFIWNFTRAIQSATTEYVMALHDDDRLCPQFIERQLSYLTSLQEVDAISCNGYLIDARTNRTGNLVIPNFDAGFVNEVTDAVDVALIYTADSCIPFSPTIYRAKAIQSVPLRTAFEKVCDATLFCDLANRRPMLWNPTPLYECRVHAHQDSSEFSISLMRSLDEFFLAQTTKQDAKIARLRRQISSSGARRVLGATLTTFKTTRSLRQAFETAQSGWSPSYHIGSALRLALNYLGKKLRPQRL